MRVSAKILVAALLFGVVFASAVGGDDKKSGRYRVVTMSNRTIEGELKEVAGGYEIKNRYGIRLDRF